MGSVFIQTPNGYVQARNRKHTPEEASAIFDAILQYAEEVTNGRRGSDIAQRALVFLKGVTYWGKPANNAGQSSVYFESVVTDTFGRDFFRKLVLRLGTEVDANNSFDFNPSDLAANKELIIERLTDMYGNINNSYVKELDKPFMQLQLEETLHYVGKTIRTI